MLLDQIIELLGDENTSLSESLLKNYKPPEVFFKLMVRLEPLFEEIRPRYDALVAKRDLAAPIQPRQVSVAGPVGGTEVKKDERKPRFMIRT